MRWPIPLPAGPPTRLAERGRSSVVARIRPDQGCRIFSSQTWPTTPVAQSGRSDPQPRTTASDWMRPLARWRANSRSRPSPILRRVGLTFSHAAFPAACNQPVNSRFRPDCRRSGARGNSTSMTCLKVQQTSRIASTVKRDWTAAAKSLAALLGVQGPLECLHSRAANWSDPFRLLMPTQSKNCFPMGPVLWLLRPPTPSRR